MKFTNGFKAAIFSAALFSLTAHAESLVNRSLDKYYFDTDNFVSVYDDVADWFAPGNQGSVVHNGCVAFASTALRHIGVNIPLAGRIDGEPVSTVTTPFSKYLEDNLHWERIATHLDLEPGDVVFTIEDPNEPGYPTHTYVFHEWDGDDGTAVIMDNQVDFREQGAHLRNVIDQVRVKKDVFSYALRAPEAAYEATAMVNIKTLFKASTAAGNTLPSSKKCSVNRKDEIAVRVLKREDSHLKVELLEDISDCGFGARGAVGYFFNGHVSVSRDD